MPINPADLPPVLEWEEPVWQLFQLLATQWRAGFGGREGLDFNPFITLMQARGWDVDLGIRLLRAIESELLEEA